jgi:P27 family predicted phage terminase small subunit
MAVKNKKHPVPDHISGRKIASAEWVRIIKAMGDVSELDYSLIMSYCVAYENCIELEKEIGDDRFLTSKKTGNQYLNPRMNLLLSYQKTLERLRKDLKLTPRSRGGRVIHSQVSLRDVI